MKLKPMSKSLRILFSVVFFISLLSACKKDNPCENPVDGTNYTLSDTAQMYLSNYIGANRIVFKTPAGSEVAFDVAIHDTTASYQVGMPCEVDTAKNQTVQGTSQISWASLSNSTAFSEPLFVNLLEWPLLEDRDAQETVAVSLGEYVSNGFDTGDELFYLKINEINPQLNFLDSILLNGKKFYAVYELNGSAGTPKHEVKFTQNQGIIYIKNLQSQVEYIYERKE